MKFNAKKLSAFVAALIAVFAAVKVAIDALPFDDAPPAPSSVSAPADAGAR